MLNELKNLNVTRPDLDELVSLHVHAVAMKSAYANFGVDQPDWLTAADKNLDREIRNRVAGELDRKRAEIKAKLTGLMSSAEKKDALLKELADLDAKQVPVSV